MKAKLIRCKYCKEMKSKSHFIHYGAESETCVHCGHAKRAYVLDLELPEGNLMNPDPALSYLYDCVKSIGFNV